MLGAEWSRGRPERIEAPTDDKPRILVGESSSMKDRSFMSFCLDARATDACSCYDVTYLQAFADNRCEDMAYRDMNAYDGYIAPQWGLAIEADEDNEHHLLTGFASNILAINHTHDRMLKSPGCIVSVPTSIVMGGPYTYSSCLCINNY
eukprot:3229990-Amphidinium_carterae.1